ncbi:B12-binding domain-containing protein [Desulfosporosinus sp. SB140]|uniref:cobalamin B12-binding domain-containing protein n=1 Tax=Desulfosporosinus paludis TaxID=3115649 RepID=UPI00388F9744
MATELTKAMVGLDEDKVYEIVDQLIAAGSNPGDIIAQCNEGMVDIGKLFEKNEYYLSELIMAGEIFKNIMSKLEPMLIGNDQASQTMKGTVVMGTVKDDIHDIGKDIVVSMLKGTGFEVVDLGVDVPPEKFVQAVKETGAKIVGVSCLLNFTFPEIKKVVDELTAAGLRDQVKVMIGGAPINEDVRVYAAADFYGKDAASAVSICKQVYQ